MYPQAKDILDAGMRLRPYIKETPVIESAALSSICGSEVHLKLENLMTPIGSFKLRGAMNKFLSLSEEEKKRGAVAVSAGNHSQAVAYCANMLGVNAVIFMPVNTPAVKIENTRGFGGDSVEIRLEGRDYDDSERLSHEYERASGRVFIHPFDDPLIIAGQGTTAIEILRSLPGAGLIVTPVGGGGLACGMALYAKSVNPQIKIVGVQPEASAPFAHSLKAGKYVKTHIGDSIADALTGDIISEEFFDFFKSQVNEVVTVSEEEIERGILWTLKNHGMAVEGGAAAAVAALLEKKISTGGIKTAAVLTGRGIDPSRLESIIKKLH